MDIADASDKDVQALPDQGIARARQALEHRELLPIGVCHYCESPVAPRHLFCPIDTVDPEQSCSILHEQQQEQRRANGT